MNITKPIFYTFIFFYLFILNGCAILGTASMGSKGELLDKNAIKKISSIVLMPVEVKNEFSDKANLPSADSLSFMLHNGLTSINLFKIIQVDSNFQMNSMDNDTLYNFIQSSAVLFSYMEYLHQEFTPNAKLTIKLVNPETKKVILYCIHDTFLGNSYFLPPSIDDITEDAIKGALDKFTELLQNQK